MSIKENRQSIISGIINSSHIRTQEELVKALQEKGIEVAQATLSRDIKELGAVKVPDDKGFYYKMPSPVIAKNPMNVDRIDISGQLCVLHAKPGFASAIASVLDAAAIDGVMGTIAGDDTILLLLREDADNILVENSVKAIFNISEIVVRTANRDDVKYAEDICREIFISSQERKTGIANRTPEYISEKILAGKAVIALSSDGDFAGFSYIESWGGKSFVATSGLIVAHKYRGMGIARRIKEQTFMLSRKLFPQAKIFSITTGAAVMKMNYDFGFRPVPYSELTDDPEFWKGCEGCRHFDILKSHDYKMCICTGLLYDPKEHIHKQHSIEE
ncbi:MAG: hypothetical protein PUC53_00565 [Bacteroidales bacterium]|nr:hypothetical protein [Bacteroidales bacterium]